MQCCYNGDAKVMKWRCDKLPNTMLLQCWCNVGTMMVNVDAVFMLLFTHHFILSFLVSFL